MLARDLRALSQTSTYFSELFKREYFNAIGFRADLNPRTKRLTINLKTTSSYEGLMIWRRSSAFCKIDYLNVRLSRPLDVATYEARIMRSFLRSLPQQSPSANVESLSIVVMGPERYQLIRLVASICKGGIKRFALRTYPMAESNHPMALSAINGTLNDLESIDLDLLPYLSPIRTWAFSTITSSAATLKILSLTNFLIGTAWRRMLLSDDVVFPALEECKFDVSITFDVLVRFVRRHTSLGTIAVVDGDELGRKMELDTSGAKLHLPCLNYLDGQALFIVALFNHLEVQPPSLNHITIRPDGCTLESCTVDKVFKRIPHSVVSLQIEFGLHGDSSKYADTNRNRIERSLDHIESLMMSQRSTQLNGIMLVCVLPSSY